MPTYRIVLICASLTLYGCQSSPEYITKREPVLPPAEYLAPCTIDYGTRTVSEVIQGLSAGIECERADKAAIRRWRDEYGKKAGKD